MSHLSLHLQQCFSSTDHSSASFSSLSATSGTVTTTVHNDGDTATALQCTQHNRPIQWIDQLSVVSAVTWSHTAWYYVICHFCLLVACLPACLPDCLPARDFHSCADGGRHPTTPCEVKRYQSEMLCRSTMVQCPVNRVFSFHKLDKLAALHCHSTVTRAMEPAAALKLIESTCSYSVSVPKRSLTLHFSQLALMMILWQRSSVDGHSLDTFICNGTVPCCDSERLQNFLCASHYVEVINVDHYVSSNDDRVLVLQKCLQIGMRCLRVWSAASS